MQVKTKTQQIKTPFVLVCLVFMASICVLFLRSLFSARVVQETFQNKPVEYKTSFENLQEIFLT